MSLPPGSSLAHYTILAPLGAGAMGEVYRARDTRLGREVAIKVLPDHFADDPERLLRFEREAKTLATLNHPNVAQIFGVDQQGDTCFLVLELVPGETLDDRLKHGPLPIPEALDVCRQIAEGLEAAHEAGVIHRDLKPANVRITPDGKVKVLDFGLAKPASAGHTPSSTDSVLSTEQGRLLGTPTYMAPEQARGKPIDRRVDVWAFGCVLYECLTATRAFAGETLTDVFAAVLEHEPDFSRIPATTPPRVRSLLRRCLAKDPRLRLRDAGEARILLGEPSDPVESAAPPARPRASRELLPWTLAAAFLALLSWIALRSSRADAPRSAAVVRFHVPPPHGTVLDCEIVNTAISPDGRKLAFLAAEPDRPYRLWIRDLASLESRPLEGTEGAQMPFWSPASDAVAYFAGARLLQVALAGGAPTVLADAPVARGGTWSEQGLILFAPFASGPLQTVPAAGGDPVTVTTLDSSRGEQGQRFPQFLPGGRRYLFASLPPEVPNEETTWIGSLDGDAPVRLLTASSRVTFAEPHWILLRRDERTFAQEIDLASGRLLGAALPTGIEASGQTFYGGSPSNSTSASGAVLSVAEGLRRGRLIRLDRSGTIVDRYDLPAGAYTRANFSPAGNRAVLETGGRISRLLLVDLARGGVADGLSAEGHGMNAVWSPDGQWVYFTTDRKTRDLFRGPSAGGGSAELLFESGNLWTAPKCCSPDGRLLVLNMMDARTGRDLWILDLASKSAKPWMSGPGDEFDARFSPDGHWVAFAATAEDERPELYVQGYPDVRSRQRVSQSGLASFGTGTPSDTMIQWSRDGSELVYLAAAGRTVLSVAMKLGATVEIGAAKALFQLPAGTIHADVSADGQSVLAIVPDERQAPPSLTVSLGWDAELAPR